MAELSQQGMSTRAIAPIVGVGNKTIHRDLAAVSLDTPVPQSDPDTGEVLERTVTGLDGKGGATRSV